MNDIRISISAEEWRALTEWMWRSLIPSENNVYGHFLLECEDEQRTWIATDGAQLVAHRTTGSPVRGEFEGDRFTLSINP